MHAKQIGIRKHRADRFQEEPGSDRNRDRICGKTKKTTNRLLYGRDDATADNLPKDALKQWHSVPLNQEEFRDIDNNVAPYLRNWLSPPQSRHQAAWTIPA